MFGFGHWEIIIVMLVVLLLFGNRLPALARSMGMSLTEFKKGIKEIDEKKSDDSKEATP
ncbi:twin-arginine translocase TatA/TatE family subunit [Aeoliella sp. SH292]|uniref:twin-arginine translocase TatA/TatE family subunit n=1 Tax=Aeoliella sp. SH292 TaxID=3454464 RepID=UPI003F982E70